MDGPLFGSPVHALGLRPICDVAHRVKFYCECDVANLCEMGLRTRLLSQPSRKFFFNLILPVSWRAHVAGGSQGLCWPHVLDHELHNFPKLFVCRGCRVFDIFHDDPVMLPWTMKFHILYFQVFNSAKFGNGFSIWKVLSVGTLVQSPEWLHKKFHTKLRSGCRTGNR